YTDPNRTNSVKMFEAPNAWKMYPNACRIVTSTAIREFHHPDEDRLFSALYRIVRRQMTFNEASASHRISLNVIREVYKTIFNSMSMAMMRLMKERKKDLHLRGDELSDEGFPFEEVTEEDLQIITTDNGEQFAVVDPSLVPPKMSRFDDNYGKSAGHIRIPRILCRPPKKPSPSVIEPVASTSKVEEPSGVNDSVIIKEEDEGENYRSSGLDVFPQQLVQPKEEEIDLFPNEIESFHEEMTKPKEEEQDMNLLHSNLGTFDNDYLVPKEEEPDEFSDGLVFPKMEHEELFEPFAGQLLNGEDGRMLLEVQSEDIARKGANRLPKNENLNQSSRNRDMKLEDDGHGDLLDCSMAEFEFREEEGEEDRKEESQVVANEDEDSPLIAESIEMALTSSKITGAKASVLREALKDFMLRNVPVVDLVNVYDLKDQNSLVHLINKSRVFLKGICRQRGKSFPAAFAASADSMPFNSGDPLDPNDTKRIQKIKDVISVVCRGCCYPRKGKEKLRAALYGVCTGEMTVNAASNKFNLPSSTITPYMMKARSKLGSLLPPQAAPPIVWSEQMKQYQKNRILPPGVATTTLNSNGRRVVTMEEIDREATAQILMSHYDAFGKQSIFDAVIAVITEGMSAPEAGKKTGIPASTIQTYVARTRLALSLPSRADEVQFVPRRREAPTLALTIKHESATREEVEKFAKNMLIVMGDEKRRVHIFRAVVATVMGELTMKEAAQHEGLASSSIHPYVTKVRHYFGSRCPPPKLVANVKKPSAMRGARVDDELNISISEDEAVTIDGITVPKSIKLLTRLITMGRVDYGHAQPFLGTREELEDKLIKIMEDFRFQGSVENLARGIMHVYVDDNTITEACHMFRLSHTTLSSYMRAVKVFIDFAKSPCTREYERQEEHREYAMLNTAPRPTDGERPRLRKSMPQPQLLPRPPTSQILDPDEIKCEMEDGNGPVKEEPFDESSSSMEASESTSSFFLSEEYQRRDAEWNGEGHDYITITMMNMYKHKGWKFDENGDNNTELIPMIFLPQVSESKRLDKLRAVIQYVVNDRHGGMRERFYIRPLLIHHMCNGFSLDHLLSVYDDRVPLTEEELKNYTEIVSNIYKKTGSIVLEFMANLTKCCKIVDVKEAAMKEERESLKVEMMMRFPFLDKPRVIHTISEQLSQEMLERRQTGCDFFMYYALLAIAELRDLGFLLSGPFLNEIVRITVYNIPNQVCDKYKAPIWATQYIMNVIEANRDSL
ncbi:hypothetical protein PMAYCL1PPCAC_30765, partial [Pristionchus mayeri]